MAKKTMAKTLEDTKAAIIHARNSAEVEILFVIRRLEKETGLSVYGVEFGGAEEIKVVIEFYDIDEFDTPVDAEDDC